MRCAMMLVAMVVAAGCSSSSGSGTQTAAAQPFVGTWNRAGTSTSSCPGQQTNSSDITGTLVIALGTTGDTFTSTESTHGCVTNYTVAGNVATHVPSQSCNFLGPKGQQETSASTNHTLTLSADGKSLALALTGTLVIGGLDGGPSITCSTTAQGTFTKQ